MENQDLLLNELTRVQELARQLEAHLNQPSTIEACKPLAQGILYSIEKAISMAKSGKSESWSHPFTPSSSTSFLDSTTEDEGVQTLDWPVAMEVEEHPSVPTASTGSQASTTSIGLTGLWGKQSEASKERTSVKRHLPNWTARVRVPSGRASEGMPDDGYTWRKYGQKDILGCKFPRSYFRCTHRNTHGCQALKKVQRSDEDPAVFEVTYRGQHMCPGNHLPTPKSVYHESEKLIGHGGDDEREVGNWALQCFGGDDEREVGNWKSGPQASQSDAEKDE